MDGKSKIETAISYRLVCNENVEMAHQWGYLEGSRGFNEAEMIFNEKYKTITFDAFYNDLVISFIVDNVKKCHEYDSKVAIELINKNIDSALQSPELNKMIKNNFKKSNDKSGKYSDENKISYYLEYMNMHYKNEKNASVVVQTIDEMFEKIMDQCRQRKDSKTIFSKEDLLSIYVVWSYLYALGDERYNELVESGICINSEESRELIYQETKRYIKIINANKYNDGEIEFSKETLESLRLDKKMTDVKGTEAEDEKKRKLKEDFFDKLEKKSLDRITSYTIDEGIEILQELYKQSIKLDRYQLLLNYYYLEQEYNILTYMIIASNLSEINNVKKVDDDMIKKISNIAILDNVIYRNDRIGDWIVLLEDDKWAENILKEIKELQELKYTILSNMPTYDHEYLIEELANFVDKKEGIIENIQKNIERFEDNKNYKIPKYYAFLKSLLKNHHEIIKVRYLQMK